MTSATLDDLSVKVTEHLIELGLEPSDSPEGPHLFRFGSSVVAVSLFEDGGDAFVRIASTMLSGFRPSVALVTRLLRLNTEVLFGSFLLFEDGTLSFAATLHGQDLTAPIFEKALHYVARVSNDFDEELQALAGGQRAQDLLGPDDEAGESSNGDENGMDEPDEDLHGDPDEELGHGDDEDLSEGIVGQPDPDDSTTLTIDDLDDEEGP
jgi:hypothetical protein